jgi:hypothetical protein
MLVQYVHWRHCGLFEFKDQVAALYLFRTGLTDWLTDWLDTDSSYTGSCTSGNSAFIVEGKTLVECILMLTFRNTSIVVVIIIIIIIMSV